MAASSSRLLISQIRKLGASIPTSRSIFTKFINDGYNPDGTLKPPPKFPIRTPLSFLPESDHDFKKRFSKLAHMESFGLNDTKYKKVDKIIAKSPQVVCCFYGYIGPSKRQTPPILHLLLKRFPHVKAYHFIIYNDSEASPRDQPKAIKGLNLNVSNLPTFRFYKNGEKVEEVVGDSIKRLKEVLEEHYK